jgi:phosphatidylglycerol:prolipoprotein diacylglycerol transferase
LHPELFKIGRVTIYSYGIMIAIGIISAVLLAYYRAKKKGLSQDAIVDISIYGVVGGFLGAKLLYIIVEAPYALKNPVLLKGMLTEGFVVYGAIIGGVLAGYVYCRVKKLNFWKYFDLVAPSIALAQGIGRIGCLFAGCCYGAETSSPLSIVFKNSPYAPNGVHLHPTQIYSSIGDFIIAAILLKFASREREDGKVAGLYMILYSIGRFLIEFLRNDPRGNIGSLSTSQFICIFVLIGGIIIYKGKVIKTPASLN